MMNMIDLFLVIAIRDFQNTFYDIESLENPGQLFASSSMEGEEPLEASELFDVIPIKYKTADVLALDKSRPSFLLLLCKLDYVANIDIIEANASLEYYKQALTPHVFVARTDVKEEGNRLVVQFWSWGMDSDNVAGIPSAAGWRTRRFRKSAFEAMGTNMPEDDGFHIIPTGVDIVT